MNRNELDKAFRALAHSSPRQASERVERQLIAGFRSAQRRRMWLPAAALAACLAITFGSVLWWMKGAHLQRRNPEVSTTTSAIALPLAADSPAIPTVMKPVVPRKLPMRKAEVRSDTLAGFIALPSAINGAPLGSPYIIRAKMTAAQLSFAGLRVMAVDPQQQIDADVLVESDGMIRAIRLRQ